MATAQAHDQQIDALVALFYEQARADALIGPVLARGIKDWPEHIRRFADFWSSVLFGTGRYRGCVMSAHLGLDLRPEHLDRWLDLFQSAANATLPPPVAADAIGFARRIGEGLRFGLFTQSADA